MSSRNEALTLFEKLWRRHEVVPETKEMPAILYVDLHLTHEVTSPQAFALLRDRHLPLRRPRLTVATMDHIVPTRPDALRALATDNVLATDSQIETLRRNCGDFAVELLDLRNERRGIVHVIGPELGLTQPGKLIVCGDSHTSSHGALGALAFGIGTTEVAHVLATQCLLQRKPRTLAVNVNGALRDGVTAKDLILAIIGELGVGGGSGFVIEYRGAAIRALDMESRLTLCNMSIEAGARAGMIAPDEVTYAWLKNRERAPRGDAWEQALADWRTLPGDEGAQFDRELTIDADTLAPMITYGTNPGMVMPVSGLIPEKSDDVLLDQALAYMGLTPGTEIKNVPVQVVFIGSCTNGRISDLRAAAEVMRGRRVARGVRMLVVPGSQQVKRQAEAEGLDRIFIEAGASWREPGCSMCIGMNGDSVARGQYCISTSNRNFEGRQGSGARTLLASPLTAAASAVRGQVTDPRELLFWKR